MEKNIEFWLKLLGIGVIPAMLLSFAIPLFLADYNNAKGDSDFFAYGMFGAILYAKF